MFYNKVICKTKYGDFILSQEVIENAIEEYDNTINEINIAVPVLFGILGMRNLSAFVGELFGYILCKRSDGLFVKNPHQDGYPDLLVGKGKSGEILKGLSMNMRDKSPFSGYDGGGIEIKATCGSVPTSTSLKKKGLDKPELGDERVSFVTGYDWKAHHRETNNLMSILWDFQKGIPKIIALFYTNNLTEEDWGKIIQPKVGGGRTTSVSIMTRAGVKKMYDGIICIQDNLEWKQFLNKYNKSDLIK